ncbi:uncharacterized protein LOC107615676 [Arachis ipaensis]|uniref:uncharacterized protein LOC107615676 n=1 Tax=Arachis ipaensis TaxID=130454 RepID=UPI0007AF2887|nr:uncharacterized protein LOC107615676 [Arachis ipaensis]
MKKLGIQEVQATRITMQMADKSLRQAYGLVENVLDKVGELFLPADSVILDMREETDDSIILRRPFLATNGGTRIDVETGKVALRLHENYMVFKVYKPLPSLDKGMLRTGIAELRIKNRTPWNRKALALNANWKLNVRKEASIPGV